MKSPDFQAKFVADWVRRRRALMVEMITNEWQSMTLGELAGVVDEMPELGEMRLDELLPPTHPPRKEKR